MAEIPAESPSRKESRQVESKRPSQGATGLATQLPQLAFSLTRNPERDALPAELLAEFEPIGEELLGEGAFAVVRLLRQRQSGDLFALKILEKQPLRIRNMLPQMEREVRIQQNLSHPNILRLVGTYDDRFYVYMVLEYCKRGPLRSLIATMPDRRLPEPLAAFYFEQIVTGVEWMHRNSCVHRDLKLENMLLTDRDVVKICDFGWSAEMEIEKMLKTTCGTTAYWAPEIWENAPQDEAVDMWALGCMLYEMLAGHAPFHEQDPTKLKQKVLAVEFGYPPWFSNEACHTVHILLQRTPGHRVKCDALLKHPWLSKHKDAPSRSAADSTLAPVTIDSFRQQALTQPVDVETIENGIASAAGGQPAESRLMSQLEEVAIANPGPIAAEVPSPLPMHRKVEAPPQLPTKIARESGVRVKPTNSQVGQKAVQPARTLGTVPRRFASPARNTNAAKLEVSRSCSPMLRKDPIAGSSPVHRRSAATPLSTPLAHGIQPSTSFGFDVLEQSFASGSASGSAVLRNGSREPVARGYALGSAMLPQNSAIRTSVPSRQLPPSLSSQGTTPASASLISSAQQYHSRLFGQSVPSGSPWLSATQTFSQPAATAHARANLASTPSSAARSSGLPTMPYGTTSLPHSSSGRLAPLSSFTVSPQSFGVVASSFGSSPRTAYVS